MKNILKTSALSNYLITTQTCGWKLKSMSFKPPTFSFSLSGPEPTQVILHGFLWYPWATEVSKRYPRSPSPGEILVHTTPTVWAVPQSRKTGYASSWREPSKREVPFMFNMKRYRENKKGLTMPVVKRSAFSYMTADIFAIWQINPMPAVGLILS